MICFKDRTFCSANCATTDCWRHWNDDLQRAAEKWMKNPPVAFADFSTTCPDYVETRDE